jgi:hypothetical protein
MPRDGRIIDIQAGGPSPEFGRIADHWVEDRLCRKLRELGLRLAGGDHVSVAFRRSVDEGVRLERGSSSSVVAHLPPGCDPTGRADEQAAILCGALRLLCEGDAEKLALIARAEVELASAGRDLEVEYLNHASRSHRFRLTHKLTPYKPGPLKPVRPSHTFTAFLEVEDLRTGARSKCVAFEFDSYDELFSTVGDLRVKDDEVIIKPKRGHHYGTPLVLPLDFISSEPSSSPEDAAAK